MIVWRLSCRFCFMIATHPIRLSNSLPWQTTGSTPPERGQIGNELIEIRCENSRYISALDQFAKAEMSPIDRAVA